MSSNIGEIEQQLEHSFEHSMPPQVTPEPRPSSGNRTGRKRKAADVASDDTEPSNVKRNSPRRRGPCTPSNCLWTGSEEETRYRKTCANDRCESRLRHVITHARNISLHRDTLRAIAKVEERERKNAAGAWRLEKQTLLADKAAAQARADDMSSDLDREIEMRQGVEAKLQKALFDLSMSQRHVDRITDMHTVDRGDPESTARQEIQRLKEACQQAQLDITNERRRWQNEVHGLQATIQEMQGDLEEACRFKHEERADRSSTSHEGLPPPYGSLNRKEYLPPYGRHKDVGKANQVNSDNAICDNFEDDLDAATGLIASNDDNSTGSHTKLVAGVLAALVEACQSIQYLHQTIDEPIDAASRAELLVNLTWRAFAAIDVRPNAAAPDRMQLTETFVLVNDVLLTLLRNAHFERRMLDELSHYHCQVERLNQGLRQMFPAGPQAYFASSTTWLHEKICKEREMIANGSRRIARRPGSA